MSSNEQMIGRQDVNDLAAILSISNSDVHSVVHAVEDNADAIFTWDYEKGKRPALNKLYEKAKHSQWNGETDLDWSIDVDPMYLVQLQREQFGPEDRSKHIGTPFEKWTDKQFDLMAMESNNWMLSQFMHGEQGALICTAKIVETVPWIDAKYYAATQVMDEARHVEVFAKYLDTKLNGH
ncbi:MAG: P-aminobenzoate N-oxygenase AurF, partial [Acidimicrobiales bacterium]|nr:P-aminobenzoate N-oxygenase AurF [Acidimicrobiales bacterium]